MPAKKKPTTRRSASTRTTRKAAITAGKCPLCEKTFDGVKVVRAFACDACCDCVRASKEIAP